MEKQHRVCGSKHLANVRYLAFLWYDGRSEVELDIEILVALGCLQERIFRS